MAAFTAALWYKFHLLDIGLSPRFTLTAATGAGSVGVLACCIVPISFLPTRVRGAAFVLLDAALSLLVFADVLHIRYYKDLFTLRNLGLSAQLGEISASVWALIEAADVRYFAELPLLVAAVGYMNGKGYWRPLGPRRIVGGLLIAVLGCGGILWKAADYERRVGGALRAMWDRPSVAVGTGTLFYHAADLRNIVAERWQDGAVSERAAWQERLAAKTVPASATGDLAGIAEGKNLIVVQVESLQAFAIDLRLGGEELTPRLNRLIAESLYFPNCYSQTASGNSSDAEFMLNVSLYPAASGVAFVRFAQNRFPSLAALLKRHGYAALAFHGDRPGFWNRNHMYRALSFDRYISTKEFKMDDVIGLGLSDRSFFRQTGAYLEAMHAERRPFYALLVTLTSHYPFDFAELRKRETLRFSETAADVLLNDYLRSVRYADEQLGTFLDFLREKGMLEESLLVVYGDHPAIPPANAEALERLLGMDLTHPAQWKSVQKVPLIVRLPDGRGGRYALPAGQMDIAPTVAYLMGFEMPHAFGRNLLASSDGALSGPVIFRNGSFVVGSTLVLPAEGKAYDIREGVVPVDGDFAATAAAAAEALALSDAVLSLNLLAE